MLRVVDTRFSRLILSLADTPVVMRSISMVPFKRGKKKEENKSKQRMNTSDRLKQHITQNYELNKHEMSEVRQCNPV